MKAENMSMDGRAWRARLTLVAVGLILCAGSAVAQESPRSAVLQAQRVGPSPKVVSRAHQPVGTAHKASSFAPHPTKRRVFGAPIPPPIVRNVTPKKPGPK
jgi:hypothetical protein